MDIPDGELRWSFDTAGGPGGQHANRSATRVELRFDVATSTAFDDEARKRIMDRLGESEVVVVVGESRSQWRNRKIAVRRLKQILEDAAAPEAPPRRRTRPTKTSQERRLRAKRRRSEIKKWRRPPED